MDVRVGLWRRLSAEELMVSNYGVEEDSWESLGLQGDPTSPFWRRSVLSVLWKDWCWSWNSSTLATSCEELSHWKRLWCWEGLGAGGEGDDRGWDGWMASRTRWTWVWVSSGRWWWTGRPGVLWFMGSQRVGHDRATELNWTLYSTHASASCFLKPLLFHFNTFSSYLISKPNSDIPGDLRWFNFVSHLESSQQILSYFFQACYDLPSSLCRSTQLKFFIQYFQSVPTLIPSCVQLYTVVIAAAAAILPPGTWKHFLIIHIKNLMPCKIFELVSTLYPVWKKIETSS